MPLFLCPNDNSQMQKISREGVDIDICPSCKGVWLDRGELDKLLVAEREESEKSVQAHRRFQEEVKSFERYEAALLGAVFVVLGVMVMALEH